MSATLHKRGTPMRIVFAMLDSANALVTGAVQGDFTIRLVKNGAIDGTAVTLDEVAASGGYTGGIYTATVTPASDGHYYLFIQHTASKRAWDAAWQVTQDGPAFDKLIDVLWQGLTSGFVAGSACTATLRDRNGNTIATVTLDQHGNRTAVA